MLENFSFKVFLEKIDLLNLVRVLIIAVIGIILVKLVRWLFRRFFFKTLNQQTLMLVSKGINGSGYFLLLLIILSELGIELTAILGTAGILGLAIGVASQKSLGNIISGFFLIAEKSFEIGDIIRIGEKTGIVYSIDNLAIMLKTFDNLLIRVPNETIISSEITNITRFPIRRLDFSINIKADEDLTNVFDLLKSVAQENPLCLDEPAPLITVKEWGESGVSVLLGVWFEKENYLTVKNEVSIELTRQFKEKGISFSYPHRVILQDSNS